MPNFRAIKKFTGAIKADPTCLKAYVCRAETFTKIHDVSYNRETVKFVSVYFSSYYMIKETSFTLFQIRNALLDFTRAIHLRPDVHHYYMYRVRQVSSSFPLYNHYWYCWYSIFFPLSVGTTCAEDGKSGTGSILA